VHPLGEAVIAPLQPFAIRGILWYQGESNVSNGVALTIDTEVHPPKILLLRGEAVLDEVEGIPDEYLQMNGTYEMTAEQRAEWETEVRSLYDSMVRIVVKPTWAKLIDFRETLPSAVEELVRRRQERQEP